MAIYTKITDEQAIEILAKYDIGEFRSLTPIASGITNSNYILETHQNKYILTIFEDIRDMQTCPDKAREIQNIAVDFMAHLHQNGLTVPEPQITRHGEKQFSCHQGEKFGAIFSFLTGAPIDAQDLTHIHCQDLGLTLARMHQAARSFDRQRDNPLGHETWQDMFDRMASKITDFEAETGHTHVKSGMQEAITYINENWPDNLPSGIVHGDLFPDNVLFDQGKLSGVIDLHDVCSDAFAYDLAICINAWCFTDEGDEITFHPARARAMIMGYNQLSTISDAAEMHFPLICQAAAMRFLMTRLYDYLHPIEDAVVTLKNPISYFKRLQFHQKMPDFNAYLNGVS